MTDRQLDMKICHLMGWTYQRGWAFEPLGERKNVTHKLVYIKSKVKEALQFDKEMDLDAFIKGQKSE